MTRQVENQLVRSLEAAASRAPAPEPGLLNHLERKGRRRQQRAQVALAGGAALAVIAGSAVAFNSREETGNTNLAPAAPQAAATKDPAPGQDPVSKALGAKPIDKVWPGAVHTIPNRLPDGRKFRPLTMADSHTLLVSVDAGYENAGELRLYDLTSKATRKVTTLNAPKDTKIFASDFTVGEGHVAWWTSRDDNGRRSIELWAAPLTGGDSYRVGQVYSDDVVQAMTVTIADGKVYWSLKKGGVYQAPLSGGTAELLKGTEKSALVRWPWVGSPLPKSWSGSGSGDVPDQIAYRTLRNLRTGEVRTATDRKGAWLCRVQWCVGDSKDGGAVQRRDGTGLRAVPGAGSGVASFGFAIEPARDRFVFIGGSPSFIYDVETKKAGRIAASDDDGFRLLNDDRLYYAQTKTGYQLVDFAAIEASGASGQSR
ncbi:hypothetical protein SAMN05421678_101223 [Actinopolymorpha cephalotaxi]|uniref:WD40-like Beta Propeller Repeat n=1 Tax=Actinopolymorpha cephalotaxi TaxID=504797 RepID=A0A1I2KFB1_9ACTN|nr:hypothetical protein [Actinopolymorpha cephalotaxi]NYH87352.1 hypothetical protein [Actinopolymorpha cephalotaxi]SFF64999.1 hypothetical protein SAMN05421678_101223 [Actinopolymorpha cephalotaxi]